ncbi:MAG TPA: MFS transporter [Fimbriimonadaceae bacterium]|nr:MFS transporter [Fimbriimonadaceae bacterium]
MNELRPYTNPVPRRRDKKGNPLPRSYTYAPPLISLDADALSEAADALRQNPEQRPNLLVWLKACNALAASDNYRLLVRDTWARIEATNERCQGKLSVLRPRLEQATARETELATRVATLLAGLGLDHRADSPALSFTEDEPVSLEVLAGEHRLPSPELTASWSHRIGYRLLAMLGGGTVFGVSLGLLTGKLELSSLTEEWGWLLFWAGVGMTVLALIGSALTPLAGSIGGALHRQSLRLPWLRGAALAINSLLLVGITTAVIQIECKVEQFGLFRSLSEQTSLQSLTLGRGDLGWVSLMLVVPAACSYLVLGLHEGERRANLATLRSLQERQRQGVRTRPEFAEAAGLLQTLWQAKSERERIQGEMALLESQVRYELTPKERLRLEDAEMEVTGHSLAAEEAITTGTARSSAPRSIGLWQRLRGLWAGRLGA